MNAPSADNGNIDLTDARRNPRSEDHDLESSAESSRAVSRRLREVRRALGMTLDEVERRSDGYWTASAVGAYERGTRNISLPRLRALADFYRVPVRSLLASAPEAIDRPAKLVLDPDAVRLQGADEPIARYLDAIRHERGDAGNLLSVRRSDVPVLCALQRVTEPELYDLLRSWHALVETTSQT